MKHGDNALWTHKKKKRKVIIMRVLGNGRVLVAVSGQKTPALTEDNLGVSCQSCNVKKGISDRKKAQKIN